MSITEGQLVWAKLRGHPDWPARVAKAPVGAKEKGIYVRFFAENGCGDHGWVPKKGITPFKRNDGLQKGTKRSAKLMACIAAAERELDDEDPCASEDVLDEPSAGEDSDTEAAVGVVHDTTSSESASVSDLPVDEVQAHGGYNGEMGQPEDYQDPANGAGDDTSNAPSDTVPMEQAEDKGFIPSGVVDEWVADNFLPSPEGILKSTMIWHFFERFCSAENYKPTGDYRKSIGNRLTRRFNIPGGYNRGPKSGHKGQLRSGLRLSEKGEKEFERVTGLDVAKIIERYP